MDDELRLLQEQFFAAQQQKSTVRLSERNVVELVNKLQQLGLLGDELLHTLNGKEYITQERLRDEILHEVHKLGRVSLVDLAATLGVDLFYVEREAQRITAADASTALVQGEILTASYWDGVAEEVEETLQESGQVSLAELARRFNVGSELLNGAISERMGMIIHGKLEGGQLYTPAYVARIKAMVRGALRGVTLSSPTASIWALVQQVQGEGLGAGGQGVGGGEGLFSSVLNECLAEGSALGSMRGGGSTWTPAVFARSQKESVEAFFSQNGYVSYSTLKKLAVPNPRHYLHQKYPEGIALETAFVHSSLVDQLEAATEEAVTGGSWCEAEGLVPSGLTSGDAAGLLALCPAVQRACRDGAAHLLAETCVVSEALVKSLVERFEKVVKARAAAAIAAKRSAPNFPSASGAKGGEDTEQGLEDDWAAGKGQKGARGKKGKRAAGAGGVVAQKAPAALEDEEDEEEMAGGARGKGKRKGGKGGKAGGGGKGGGGGGGGKGGAKAAAKDEEEVPDEDEMEATILEWYPDMEGVGRGDAEEGGPGALARMLVQRIRPALVAAWAAARRAAFTAGAEERKRRREALQGQLEGLWGHLQLFSRGLEVFQEDASTLAVLQRHLLRTSGSEMADLLLRSQALEHRLAEEGEVAESPADTNPDAPPGALSSSERLSLARSLPDGMTQLAVTLAEAVDGKSVEGFEGAVAACAEESGIRLRRLDKRGERALLHAHRKALAAHLEAEEDPVAALPLAASLLFIQVHHRALHAPGRALAMVIASLRDGLPAATHQTLTEYHMATVECISRRAAGGGEEDDLIQQLAERVAQLKTCTLQRGGEEAS